MGEVAAVMREIWIRRQDHPAIDMLLSRLLVYFFSDQAPPRPVVKRHDTNGKELPSQTSNRQTPKPDAVAQQNILLQNPFS